MKRMIVIGLILATVVGLSGCVKPKKDPYKAYRAYSEKELFDMGERQLASKDYGKAVKTFEAEDVIYPFGPYARQGQLDIIYAYYKDGDNEEAIAAGERYAHLYPQGPGTDYAYYMRGMAGFQDGMSWLQKKLDVDPAPRDISTMQGSFSAFSKVQQHFPRSVYAPASLQHMAYIRNLMARRQLMIAEFYKKHAAYVAAANRASIVVQHFQGSPQVPNALAMMVTCYRKLHLTQQEQSTLSILKSNYPDSEAYKNVAHS